MGDELNNKRRREFLGASAQALSGVVVVGSAMAATPDTPALKEPGKRSRMWARPWEDASL